MLAWGAEKHDRGLWPTTHSRVRLLGGIGLGAVLRVNPRHSEYKGVGQLRRVVHMTSAPAGGLEAR